MNCKEVYQYLSSYLDGELDPEKKIVKAHLESCSACRAELDTQKSIKFLVQKHLPVFKAPNSLKSRVMFELGRIEDYRESGVQVLDLVCWGTHVAQFYNNKSDLNEVLVPYLVKGLDDNEMCLWVTSDMSNTEAMDSLSQKIPDVKAYVDKCQLHIVPYRDWYLSEGYFDIGKALNKLLGMCQKAQSDGYSGFRATGIVSWLDRSVWNDFMEYERLVDRAVPDQKALAICVYNGNKCTENQVKEVADRHKYVISKVDDFWRLKRKIIQNHNR